MMHGRSVVAGSTHSDDILPTEPKRKYTFISRCTEIYESKFWKPPALRAPVLILTITICWALIAILEFLLFKSQRNSGLIFAPKINDLPLRDTFLYLYFPTILAVLFSIYWSWIDLETKRMEPYYQLSKENGALGKHSILLHYPFSFIPLVPFRAFRDRHWPVFWASFTVVLVTWGLVPTQAGIFSVRTVTRTANMTFVVSTASLPVAQQSQSISFRYMQSTYGIASLNETMPPFVARNYTLTPFAPLETELVLGQGIYTAPTIMYSLDLTCDDASHRADNSSTIYYTSSGGCNFTVGLTGNETLGDMPGEKSPVLATKQYTGMYAGYHSGGFADYYLESYCPETENSTFYAAFAKSKARKADSPKDVTAIFCQPRYYQQQVTATIDILTKRPSKVVPISEKQQLGWDILNITMFETLLNAGSLGNEVRADTLPAKAIPKYLETIASTNVSLTNGKGGAPTHSMVGLTVGTTTVPLEDLLDWKKLAKAYADAYRLLFSRAMVDVLGADITTPRIVAGQRQLTTEAVVLEPVFVHIVAGCLGVVSIASIALLIITCRRTRNLSTDPSTIASVMSLVADDQRLLADFADLDCCTMDDMHSIIGEKRYRLFNDDTGTGLMEIAHVDQHGPTTTSISALTQRRNSPSSIAEPVRPIEFSMWIVFPLVTLFVLLAVALGVISSKAKKNGLPLPSSNSIVQNILENYIPTAIATMIEPIWILINRLLCMLQPLEELRGCNAKAKKSIDLNYSSLPPQLVVFKALKSKHFVLAAVCAMALLANLLAVSFAGLFNQGLIDMRRAATFQPPFDYKFVSVNGSIGPVSGRAFGSSETSGAYQGGNGEDQFLIAESNYTRNTPLPAWTDDAMFYMPAFSESNNATQINSTHLEAVVNGIGAELDCTQLEIGKNFSPVIEILNKGIIRETVPDIRASMNVTIATGSGSVQCRSPSISVRPGPVRQKTICLTGPTALEMLAILEPRVNATQREKDVCMGSVVLAWIRDSQGSCPLGKDMSIDKSQSLFVQCRPRLTTRTAKIRVDASGRLQSPASEVISNNDVNEKSGSIFSNDPINIIGQSNRYLFRFDGGAWHNDSFADDFINYFVRRDNNSTRLVDPNQPVPSFDDVAKPLSKAYSKLFAIWLGTNKNKLFVPSASDSIPLKGARVVPEQRLFLSTTMFIISEVILCTYAIVAIWVYLRRPGRYLARLPTSIAALIALFAASAAVQDMQGTSQLDKKGRARHLEKMDARYGYGSFIGGDDGRVHIGIEKTPFVRTRAKTTWLEQKLPLFRKASGGG